MLPVAREGLVEIAVIAIFCLLLAGCNILGFPLIAGLAAGLVLFCGYALFRKFSCREIARIALSGIKTAKDVLLAFLCIGILSGLWRASGTIAALVSLANTWCDAQMWIAFSFLSCAAVSFLMGTAFGTCATMGTVCMTTGNALGIHPLLLGGAVFAGCYFGDRCSPVSATTLLVSRITDTSMARNIPAMLKSAAVPFCLALLLYASIGLTCYAGQEAPAAVEQASVAAGFSQSFAVFVPAIIVLVLPLLRVSPLLSILTSSISACIIAVAIQDASAADALRTAVFGFTATGEQSVLMNGGGMVSMAMPGLIVLIATSYSGILQKTGLLEKPSARLRAASAHGTPFCWCFVASVLFSLVACSQTLAIMLTNEVYQQIQPDQQRRAIDLADSAACLSPLVPWSIAAIVPVSMMDVPASCLLFAFFLYALPLWRLCSSLVKTFLRKKKKQATSA